MCSASVSVRDLKVNATVSRDVRRAWRDTHVGQSTVEGYSAHGTWLRGTLLPQAVEGYSAKRGTLVFNN